MLSDYERGDVLYSTHFTLITEVVLRVKTHLTSLSLCVSGWLLHQHPPARPSAPSQQDVCSFLPCNVCGSCRPFNAQSLYDFSQRCGSSLLTPDLFWAASRWYNPDSDVKSWILPLVWAANVFASLSDALFVWLLVKSCILWDYCCAWMAFGNSYLGTRQVFSFNEKHFCLLTLYEQGCYFVAVWLLWRSLTAAGRRASFQGGWSVWASSQPLTYIVCYECLAGRRGSFWKRARLNGCLPHSEPRSPAWCSCPSRWCCLSWGQSILSINYAD